MLWSEIDTIALDLCDATDDSFPVATRLIYANQAQEDITGTIIGLDGRWQFDDSNFTNLPIGKRDLEANQQDYDFDADFLHVIGVSVKDENGKWNTLKPIDKSDIDIDLEEYKSTDGIPLEYDKIGNSVFLYPAPSYTQADSLKVHFQRGAVPIESFETTSSAGFYPAKHIILAYMIALPYCQKYKQERVALYEKKIMELKEDIKNYYSKRTEDERDAFTVSQESTR